MSHYIHVALLKQIYILADMPKIVDYFLSLQFTDLKQIHEIKGLYYFPAQQDVTVNFAKQLCFSFLT